MSPSRPLPLIPWSKSKVLEHRNSKDASREALNVALDLMVLNYPAQANRIVETLYNAGKGILFDRGRNLYPLYQAWEATGSTPSFIINPDPDKLFNGIDDTENGNKLKEEFNNWPHHKWPTHLKDKADKECGPEDLESVLENLNLEPLTFTVDSTPLSVALEIAVSAGQYGKAKELIDEHVFSFYKHFQDVWNNGEPDGSTLRQYMDARLEIGIINKAWTVIHQCKIGLKLQVDELKLDEYVSEGCRIVEQRFTTGVARQYADKTIPDLLRIMDESYLAARRANLSAGEHMSLLNDIDETRVDDTFPQTFLKSPASDEDIAELEKRTIYPQREDGTTRDPVSIPDDYRELLKFSNGFYPGDDSMDQTGIFYAADVVACDGGDVLAAFDYTLFPYEYTDINFENITLPRDPKDYLALNIGAGGDEGYLCLVLPETTRKVIKNFGEVYQKASEREKRLYERAALDLYGGIDKVWELEWLVVVMYHWDPDEQIWGSIQDYLELEAIPYAVQRRKDDEKEQRSKKRNAEGQTKDEETDGSSEKEAENNKEEDAEVERETDPDSRYELRSKLPRTE